MTKMKRTMAGLIAGAAVLTGVGAVSTVAAGAASASSCTYHTRMMFGNNIVDGYGGDPQAATQNAYSKAKAHGLSTVGGKRMGTQYECR